MTPFPRVTWAFYIFECGDWTTTSFATSNEVDALEWVEDFASKGLRHRVIRTDFDHETGEPEAVRDVTDDLTDWQPSQYDLDHARRVEEEIMAAE